jgi:hypothetical protein
MDVNRVNAVECRTVCERAAARDRPRSRAARLRSPAVCAAAVLTERASFPVVAAFPLSARGRHRIGDLRAGRHATGATGIEM